MWALRVSISDCSLRSGGTVIALADAGTRIAFRFAPNHTLGLGMEPGSKLAVMKFPEGPIEETGRVFRPLLSTA